jgi:2-oxoglutarate ferredoxin oxidoreductase subunit delta
VDVCPSTCIVLDPDTITDKGYHPAMLTDESLCTGCANCAVMCPDVAITVER